MTVDHRMPTTSSTPHGAPPIVPAPRATSEGMPGYAGPYPPAGMQWPVAGVQAGAPSKSRTGLIVGAAVAVIVLLATAMVVLGFLVAGKGAASGGSAAAPIAAPAVGAPVPALPAVPAPAARAGSRTLKPGESSTLDSVFLQAIREQPTFKPKPDGELLGFGESACTMLDQGQTLAGAIASGVGQNLQAEDAGYLLGVSVATYCPQHMAEVEQFTGEKMPTI